MHSLNARPAQYDLAVQTNFWNKWIAEYLEKESLGASDLRRGEVVVQLVRSLNLSRPNILEVGCANGWLSAALANFGQVTGVDLADEAIAAAKKKYAHINFIAGDFLALDLPAERFDLAVSVDVISYFEDLRSFMDKLAASLRARGHLILVCPHKFVWDRMDFVRRSHGEIPLNWLNMGDLKGLLRHHFSLLHSETVIPGGNRGILRLINSAKLNKLIQNVVPESHIVRLKERTGLGKSLVVVAQKRI
jgi:2-polyprenyl-3-methyl-5-hydroxy-6-metoxy-1,4-benzoquinol methylase